MSIRFSTANIQGERLRSIREHLYGNWLIYVGIAIALLGGAAVAIGSSGLEQIGSNLHNVLTSNNYSSVPDMHTPIPK